MSTKRFPYVVRLFFVFALVLLSASPPVFAMPLGQSSGDMDIDGYCRYLGYNGSRLDPTQQNVFGWGCLKSDGTQAGMDLYDLCRWQYGGELPYPEYSEYANPYSWFCSTDDLNSPVERPQEVIQDPPTSDYYPGIDGNCGNALYPKKDANGNSCRVIDGRNVWSEPNINSQILGPTVEGNLSLGTEVCNQGYRWYLVSSQYGNGWERESGNTACHSNPGPVTSLPTPSPAAPDVSDTEHSEKWCSQNVQAYSEPSWLWDPRFYVRISKSAWDANQDHIRFYYNDELLDKWVVDPASGLLDDDYWKFGVRSRWAWQHWFWQIDSNWRVEIAC